jgi:aconitate hydratase 2/2-methylisocitrate dehydratase
MTRGELKHRACLGLPVNMVMQSFCHTAAYPKLVDVKTTGSRNPQEAGGAGR